VLKEKERKKRSEAFRRAGVEEEYLGLGLKLSPKKT